MYFLLTTSKRLLLVKLECSGSEEDRSEGMESKSFWREGVIALHFKRKNAMPRSLM